MENRIKVLIADGSEAFCGHLKNELQQLDGYDLVGTAADGEEAVRLLEANQAGHSGPGSYAGQAGRHQRPALRQRHGQAARRPGDLRVYYRLRSHDRVQPGCAIFDDEALRHGGPGGAGWRRSAPARLPSAPP